jgi:hypothetical protein
MHGLPGGALHAAGMRCIGGVETCLWLQPAGQRLRCWQHCGCRRPSQHCGMDIARWCAGRPCARQPPWLLG